MPTYIILIKWTQTGIETVKDAPQRIERAHETLKSVGGELKALYFTFGRYDMVSLVEAPSDEAIAKAVLTIGRWGAASLETLKAFPEKDGVELIRGLP